MKKIISIAAIALMSVGCASAISPVNGAFTSAKWDGAISNPEISSINTGKACAQSVLGLIATGDASIETAKKNAGISKVATVDHKTINILFLYGQYCTIVSGE